MSHQTPNSSGVKSVVITSGTAESPVVILDPDYAFEKVVVMVDPAEAAKMAAASTLFMLVGDNEVMKIDGSAILAVTKPAASVGIHQEFPATGARRIKIGTSANVTADMTVKVMGVNRILHPDVVAKATI